MTYAAEYPEDDQERQQQHARVAADNVHQELEAQKFPSEANKTCVIAPHIAQQEPIDAEGRAVKRIMPTDEPLKFWYTRKGYNDFMFLEGDKNGSVAYYVDVRADISGWNIYLKRGATIDAPCVLHITKGTRLIWDKGTPVLIETPMPQHEVTTMTRKYEFVNKYTFPYNGRMYTWEWMELLGGCHYLKDAETHDVICIARFKYTIALQIISAWGMRLKGGIEIYGVGKQMVDVIMATLAAQIEWRKHNNKLMNIWTTIPGHIFL